MDTSVSNIDGTMVSVSSDERAWINRVLDLKEEHPDDVIIKMMPEDNDGCIYAWVPSEWFRPKFALRPKKSIELTEEQRSERSERMKRVLQQVKST